MTDPDRYATSGDLASFHIRRQPDDVTCGPTCLDAVYRYFGDSVPFDELLQQVETLEGGGTLGVLLATHALRRGYEATIVTCNLQVFDPTWFGPGAPPLPERLRARAAAKADPKLQFACRAYVEYVEAGGRVELHDIDPPLLRRYLRRGLPILAGLSASFLYREARELPDTRPDDVAGDPTGHFVVLTGYREGHKQILVSDPLHPNPLAAVHTYPVDIQRVIGAIYLGVLTHDANLVIVRPSKAERRSQPDAGDTPLKSDADDRRRQ